MIAFDLTPEQKALQERARRFSKEVILPVAAKHDKDGVSVFIDLSIYVDKTHHFPNRETLELCFVDPIGNDKK